MSSNTFLEIIDNALTSLNRRESINSGVQNRRNFAYRRTSTPDNIFELLNNNVSSVSHPFNVIDEIITKYIDVMSSNQNTIDLSSINSIEKQTPKNRSMKTINNALGGYKKIKKCDGLLKNNEECIICQENYKLNEGKRILPCKHTFHKKCVDKWFINNNECPMCRKIILD